MLHRALLALLCVPLVACGEIGVLSAIGGPDRDPDGGGGGGAGVPDVDETRVEAVAMLISVPRGEDELDLTAAQLAVIAIDDDGAYYVSGVDDPVVIIGNEEIDLQTTNTTGVFVTNSDVSPELVYEPGATYTFKFTVVDSQGDRKVFEQPVTAPETIHTVEIPFDQVFYAQEPVELELIDMPDAGAIAVTPLDDPDSATWLSFEFEGPDAITESLNSLLGVDGPTFEIPGSAFPEPGDYRIEVHGYGIGRSTDVDESRALGPSSWATAGQAVVIEANIE